VVVPSWRVHRALASLVSAGLPRDAARGLLAGVVEPDAVPDLEVRCRGGRCRAVYMRHHAGVPRGLVKYYFNLACFYRARGNLHAAGRALGRALHYIHDVIGRRLRQDYQICRRKGPINPLFLFPPKGGAFYL
jgi:hypothetical protein